MAVSGNLRKLIDANAPLWAGECCSVVNDIKPAAQIVADLMREAGG